MLLTELLQRTIEKNLYVYRGLLNGDDLQAWAKEQGFKTTLESEDMHVTIAYSKEKFDWSGIQPEKNKLIVRSGQRKIRRLGDAIVLMFTSNRLRERWAELVDAGASWDFPQYISHVSLSFENEIPLNTLKHMIPYTGELIFGGEIFQEIEKDWSDGIEEVNL